MAGLHGLLNIKHLLREPKSLETSCVSVTGHSFSPPCFFSPNRPTRCSPPSPFFYRQRDPCFLPSWHHTTVRRRTLVPFHFTRSCTSFFFDGAWKEQTAATTNQRGHLDGPATATALSTLPRSPHLPTTPFSLANLIVTPRRLDRTFGYPSSIDPDLSDVCALDHSLGKATDTAHQGRATADRLKQLLSSLTDVILPPFETFAITE